MPGLGPKTWRELAPACFPISSRPSSRLAVNCKQNNLPPVPQHPGSILYIVCSLCLQSPHADPSVAASFSSRRSQLESHPRQASLSSSSKNSPHPCLSLSPTLQMYEHHVNDDDTATCYGLPHTVSTDTTLHCLRRCRSHRCACPSSQHRPQDSTSPCLQARLLLLV